jgi:hypothetical protein
MPTKISVKKKDPDAEGDETKTVSTEKKTKIKVKKGKELPTQYGLYSGIVTEKGAKDNPTETEAISNMVDYMKNNNPPESTSPSNVYRRKFSHLGIAYDRKKKQNNA